MYCTQYISKFGKLSSDHRTGKGQFSFQFHRRTMPKNVQTTIQLCSVHMLARLCSKFFKLVFNSMWTVNFQMFKMDLEKAVTRDHIADICWIIEKAREFQKDICFIYYTKRLSVDHNKLLKIKRWEYQTTLPASWETCMQVKATVKTRYGTMDLFQIGKGVTLLM